jgi:ethanolamine utilization protein EutA
MAAHGLAVARSREAGAVLNVDIGGGTTKLAVCRDGEVVDTAVVNVSRLIAHQAGRITRLEDAGARLGEAGGAASRSAPRSTRPTWRSSPRPWPSASSSCWSDGPLAAHRRSCTVPLADPGPVAALIFSGSRLSISTNGRPGSSAIWAGGSATPCGDGWPPTRSGAARPCRGHPGDRIGAAQYTVQVSGSTVFHPRSGVLPLRNVPVFPVRLAPPLSADAVAEAVRRAVGGQDDGRPGGPLALALRWPFGPGYAELRALGEGLVAGLGARSAPTVLAFDRDIARLVGHLMVEELGAPRDLVAVDELELGTFDYVDVGEPLPVSGVIPVVIKSLVFRPAL